MDKSTHDEHLSQPLQRINKQFKHAVTFSTGYNGIFNVKNSNNKFCFTKTPSVEDGFSNNNTTTCLRNRKFESRNQKEND